MPIDMYMTHNKIEMKAYASEREYETIKEKAQDMKISISRLLLEGAKEIK